MILLRHGPHTFAFDADKRETGDSTIPQHVFSCGWAFMARCRFADTLHARSQGTPVVERGQCISGPDHIPRTPAINIPAPCDVKAMGTFSRVIREMRRA
jgi:hypothetical protein